MLSKPLTIFCILLVSVLFGGEALAQSGTNLRYQGSRHELWFGTGFGFSRMQEDAPDSLVAEIRDFYNDLRTGWNYGFDAQFFVNPYLGFGAAYGKFTTRKQADSLQIKIFAHKYFIEISSEIYIHHLSATVFGKMPLFNDRLVVSAAAGPAWLFYRNPGKAIGDTSMFKGSSPGLSTSLRISYQVLPRFSPATTSNYLYILLKKFVRDDGDTEETKHLEKDNYQNISRLDFNFGLY